MDMPAWSWIPLVVAASFCHSIRNATQWRLSARIGGVSATLVRFFFGLPFALAWLVIAYSAKGQVLPPVTPAYIGNVVIAAALQVAGTAMLLAAMRLRGFTVAVVFSKTEVVQLALLSILILGEVPTALAFAAIVLATVGVTLLASPSGLPSLTELKGPLAVAAGLGVGAGAAFGGSNVFFRAAALSLEGSGGPLLSGALATALAQVAQTAIIGGYLLVKQPDVVRRMFLELPSSLLAGVTSTMASALGFTALAMRPATDVRALGLVEVIFTYVISRRLFQEVIGGREVTGVAMLVAGVLIICLRP